MTVRKRFLLPVLLALAGCASTPSPMADGYGPTAQTSAASPQRVQAASSALGQRLDSMLANPRIAPMTVTR